MTQSKIKNQTLALAGLFQAAHLVEQLAKTGQANDKDLKICIESIFQTDPGKIEDIYGGSSDNVKIGFKEVRFLTDGKSRTGSSPDVMRYALGILHLESKLKKNKTMMNKIAQGIDSSKRQLDHFHSSHENLIANLSGLYQEKNQNPATVCGEIGYIVAPNGRQTLAIIIQSKEIKYSLSKRPASPRVK